MQNLNNIFYAHLINPKVWHCLCIFSKIEKNYIWEEFHNHLTDPFEKIKLIHFMFDFPIKYSKKFPLAGDN